VSQHRVLAIGLDGFDIGFGSSLIDSGQLPTIAALRDQSRRFLLDHGAAARTGLAWEHFASGMTPESARRASMVELVDGEYDTAQCGTRFAPFFSSIDARVVVFDSPYTDISRAPRAQGAVGWAGHDPGVNSMTNPREIRKELETRFAYPSKKWLYAAPWPSPSLCVEAGDGLVRGINVRREAARWILAERCPDWDLGIIVVSELHAAAEAFWHGIDPAHPLHSHPSAPPAARSLADVYRAADGLVRDLIDSTAPRSVIVFSMGGMGSNNSDVPSMVLLPELLYRWSTGHRLLDVPGEWSDDPATIPLLSEDQKWDEVLAGCFPGSGEAAPRTLTRRVAARLPASVRDLGRRALSTSVQRPATAPLDWMPAMRYRAQWPTMRAFALPSFYDGRVRLNVRGREPGGIVDPAHYEATCDELESLVLDCCDPRTGAPSVVSVERPGDNDPFALGSTDADLTLTWGSPACALFHAELGLVGPVPFKRTGGHTGPYGFAFLSDEDVEVGDGGIRSAFDVPPTIETLLDVEPSPGLDGTSMVTALSRTGRQAANGRVPT
jgi:predicted AlkP superfamily phosphohydrolase/phosphomutase